MFFFISARIASKFNSFLDMIQIRDSNSRTGEIVSRVKLKKHLPNINRSSLSKRLERLIVRARIKVKYSIISRGR